MSVFRHFHLTFTAYCNTENDFNQYNNFNANYTNPYIGYFADLYFFELMNRDVQRRYLSNIIGST